MFYWPAFFDCLSGPAARFARDHRADRAGDAMRAGRRVGRWRSRGSMHRRGGTHGDRMGGVLARDAAAAATILAVLRAAIGDDIQLPGFATVAFGLVCNVSAFLSENFRAGIASIRVGQCHAGLALGMSETQAFFRVVVPQAWSRVMPETASMWVELFKETSLVSTLAVADLTYQALALRTENYRTLEVLTRAGGVLSGAGLSAGQDSATGCIAVSGSGNEPAMSDSTSDHRRHANDEPALIRIEDVHRRYPTGVEALRGVSLTAHEGEVVCIIGPSGSGKSTLLRCVNGLEPIDRGRILFDGREVRVKGRERARDPPAHRHGVPELRTIPAYDRAFQRRARVRARCCACLVPRSGAGARIPCQGRPCGQGATRCRRSYPAGSSSASRSLARSPCSRARCCSTRQHRRLIRRLWARCSVSCSNSPTKA